MPPWCGGGSRYASPLPVDVPASPVFEAAARGAQFRDRIVLRVEASPQSIFRALREVTLTDMRLAWFLGELRYLPARLSGRLTRTGAGKPFLSVLEEGGTLVLTDDSPRELVTGSAGQLHRIVDQEPVRFSSREAFDAFADPHYEKLFMSLRVAPTGRPGEHWLVLEHATHALSPDAGRRFRRYWRVIKPMGAFVSRELLKAVRDRAHHLEKEASLSLGV